MNTHTLQPFEERPFVLILMVALLFTATVFAGVLVIGNDATSTGGGGAGPGSAAAVAVSDALVAAPGTPLLVRGLLFVATDGTVYLADALLESYPPQIDSAHSLRVDGFDVEGIAGLQQAGGVAWSDAAVELSGTVSAGTLLVAG